MDIGQADIRLVQDDIESVSSRRPSTSEIEQAVRTLIAAAGDDPTRDGLLSTPSRVAKAYREWFAGYSVEPRQLLERTFSEVAGYSELVLLQSIPVRSTCEHHMAPITGIAHVGYLPVERVVGISKLARVVDAYSRRLQIQERLTQQIGAAIFDVLKPRGVAVVMEATHGCMSSRGVGQSGMTMITKCWLGAFETSEVLRREFTESIRHDK